jgi:pimeloyl-ACP methyl ester carboxylesterase
MAIDIYSKQTVLTLAGGPVCVYEAGEEGNPPVLLLHGAMYDEARLIWHHLAPMLSRERHVFALDFPRHGKSRPWAGNAGQECLIEVVKEVIRYFNLVPLPLVGLSMGGGVAIGYMLRYPEEVSAGVFMNPGGLGDKVQSQFLSWLFTRTPGALRVLTHMYARYDAGRLGKTLAPLLHDREKTVDFQDIAAILYEEAQAKRKHGERAMDDWQIAGLAPFQLKINLLPELHRLSRPTLWLRGKDDPLVGQSAMEEAARLSNGILRVVENAGHMLPLEQPDEVYRLVREFLSANKL